jgi:hypothetical protein
VANADRLMSLPAPAVASSGPAVQRCGNGSAHEESVQREEAPPAEDGEEEKMARTFVQRAENEEMALSALGDPKVFLWAAALLFDVG